MVSQNIFEHALWVLYNYKLLAIFQGVMLNSSKPIKVTSTGLESTTI